MRHDILTHVCKLNNISDNDSAILSALKSTSQPRQSLDALINCTYVRSILRMARPLVPHRSNCKRLYRGRKVYPRNQSTFCRTHRSHYRLGRTRDGGQFISIHHHCLCREQVPKADCLVSETSLTISVQHIVIVLKA